MNHESKAVQKHKKTTDIEVTRDHPVFAPATDIYEKSDAVMVVCDIPGVDKKNVDVMLENGVLTITGRQDTTEPEGCKLLQRGYRSGVFRRTFNVTADIDMSKIDPLRIYWA